MAGWLTCPRGHRWEAADGVPPACPVCAALSGPETVVIEPGTPSVPSVTMIAEDVPAAEIAPPTIPGYEILDIIARGGMGVVYRARQISLDRIVALKMILAGQHAGDETLTRFRTEARAVARLQHPNIIQVYEVGEHQGLPFFSLELCAGGSLEQRLAGTPLPPREAAELVARLARALHAAHEAGVVHRDLKPANVLITADGTPKITDFGLAKKLDDRGQTHTGAILGTPSYMAPEQAQGQGKVVGPTADVWALGAVLYECLTGRPPFRGPTPLETVLLVVNDEPVPPARLQPGTPRDLETVCLKCLQKDPKRRYSTALALADDLGRFLSGETVLARPTPTWERGWKWSRRNPARALALFLLAVPLPCLLIYVAALWREAAAAGKDAHDRAVREQEARHRAEDERRQADLERERTAALLYAARITLAHREWSANNVGRVRPLLEECPARFRGWEWHYLRRLDHPEDMAFHKGRGSFVRVAWCPHGHFLAAEALTPGVTVYDLRTGLPLYELAGATSPAFSPDGHRLAIASNADVKVHDAATGHEVLRLRGHAQPIRSVAYLHGGRRLAAAAADGTILYWEALSGRQVGALTVPLPSGAISAFSPDGRRIAAGGLDGIVRVWDARTGEEVHKKEAHRIWVGQPAFSPDSRRLATPGGEGAIRIWDTRTGDEATRLRGHVGGVHSVAWSSDGKRLLSTGQDMTARVWDASGGEEIVRLRGHISEVPGGTFSPDGRHVATASLDGSVRTWDTESRRAVATLVRAAAGLNLRIQAFPQASSQESLTFYGHLAANWDAAFGPGGRALATSAQGDGLIKVWDVATRTELHTLSVPARAAHRLAFAPTERLLAIASAPWALEATELRLWDLDTGHLRSLLRGPRGTVAGVAFAPDGKHIAFSAGGPEGGALKVIAVETGKEAWSQPLPPGTPTRPAYSPDGRLVVLGGDDGRAYAWDAPTGAERFVVGTINDPAVLDVALREGFLATAHDDWKVRLWDLGTGRQARLLEGHVGPVRCLAFSPDGRRLASSGTDLMVKVWDVETGRDLLSLREHAGLVHHVAWSPDGRRLAGAGQDGTTRIWEIDAPPNTSGWQVVAQTRDLRPGAGQWTSDGNGHKVVLRPQGASRAVLANIGLEVPLPSTAEVTFECQLSSPGDVEVKLLDATGASALSALLMGTDKALGHSGAALLQQGAGRTFATDAAWPCVPLKRHQVRVVRQPRRLTLFVDGEQAVSARVLPLATPRLVVQALRAEEGAEFALGDLKVRAPADAIQEEYLRPVVTALLAEPLPRADARERLWRLPDLSERDRRIALRLVEELALDASKLHAVARRAVLRPGEDAASGLTLRRAQAAVALAPDRGDYLETLALAHLRAGRPAEALDDLDRAEAASRASDGATTAAEHAVRALCHQRLGEQDQAVRALGQLRDALRCSCWPAKDDVPLLAAEAEALVGPQVRPATDVQREEDRIKTTVIAAEEAGWLRHDPKTWMSLWADEVQWAEGRSERPNSQDVVLDRTRLEALARLLFAGPAKPGRRLVFEGLEVHLEGATAQVRGRVISGDGAGRFETYQVVYQLRRGSAGWKAFALRSWAQAGRDGPQVIFYDGPTYRRLDEAVEQARARGEPTALAEALAEARLFGAAHAAAQKATALRGARASTWLLRGRLALRAGDATDALASFQKARALDAEALPPNVVHMLDTAGP